MRRIIPALVAVLIASISVVGYRYNDWVSNSEGPYDEVGIGLHGYMPTFIQNWGCAKLQLRFGGKALPPYGCGDAADPAQWRDAG